MNRRKFLAVTGASLVVAGGAGYLLSDQRNFVRTDIKEGDKKLFSFMPGENEILSLASLAPSGHNTQPWFIKYINPYHWIIGNDKTKWLPGVDPTQRETILSIGAFMQNLEYAANNFGYNCTFKVLAATNQDEDIAEVNLTRAGGINRFDTEKIKNRRTVRSGYLKDRIKKEDVNFLINDETDSIYFLPKTSQEYNWLNEQTIEANRVQAYRDDAQRELGEWIRFSGKDAEKHLDGLTTASMEINGMAAWFLRNFYSKEDVMKNKFRERGIDKIIEQVSASGGWFLICSKNYLPATLLETGMRFQRMLLKIKEKNIAVHPMTQILEESATKTLVNRAVGLTDPVQFVLRTGYVKNYPNPVSLRRPVEQIIRSSNYQ